MEGKDVKSIPQLPDSEFICALFSAIIYNAETSKRLFFLFLNTTSSDFLYHMKTAMKLLVLHLCIYLLRAVLDFDSSFIQVVIFAYLLSDYC